VQVDAKPHAAGVFEQWPIAPRCWRISRSPPSEISSRAAVIGGAATTIELYDATRLEKL